MNHETNHRPRRKKPNPASRPRVPVVRPAVPRTPAEPPRRTSNSVPNRPVPRDHAMVASPAMDMSFDDFDGTAMFDTLDRVRALPANEVSRAIVCRSIAEARGYTDEELFAMAEVGYHYLRSGGLRLALVVFEGLTAIKPDEPYFWLALGLAADYLDDKPRAQTAYKTAIKLDPEDARPDLNLAELCFERRDIRRAQAYLRRARDKAERRGDPMLARKADALLTIAAQ